jgi:hypothetical protein
MSSTDGQTFTVYIDDNYDFMDKDARYKGGDFNTFEEAVAFCKTIVWVRRPPFYRKRRLLFRPSLH